jgi:hypothetical protein
MQKRWDTEQRQACSAPPMRQEQGSCISAGRRFLTQALTPRCYLRETPRPSNRYCICLRPAQIDAHRASEYLLRCCQELGGSEGRFEMRCGVTVERLLMECCSVEIGGVATSAGEYNCLYAATAFVLAFLCNMLCVRCTALVVR